MESSGDTDTVKLWRSPQGSGGKGGGSGGGVGKTGNDGKKKMLCYLYELDGFNRPRKGRQLHVFINLFIIRSVDKTRLVVDYS